MYKVIELQRVSDETTYHIVQDATTFNEAQSNFHTILAAAAISTVPVHGAIIITDFAEPVEFRYFDHRPAPTPVESNPTDSGADDI